MARPVISCHGLGKCYRIGSALRPATTLREAMVAVPRRLVGLRRKAGQVETRERQIWALRSVTFDVREGEALGVIGANGAGKSTLLKILARITDPTEGEACLRGRVGSLLEVGTGFHSELTGRENIYLAGSILGMRRQEIRERFDAIVDFAEVWRFIDTPIKHYSTGMGLRLAFAVAAHLEPEVLLIDEVLAVGDLAFQKRCLGKMNEIAHAGRTILFVSHNLSAISTLCDTAVLLREGRIVEHGAAADVVGLYQGTLTAGQCFEEAPLVDGLAAIVGGRILGPTQLRSGECLRLEVDVDSAQELSVSLNWRLSDAFGAPVVCGVPHLQLGCFQCLQPGRNRLRLDIGPLPLFAGSYRLSFDLNHGGREHIHRIEDRLGFEIVECDPAGIGATLPSRWRAGSVVVPFSITVEDATPAS